MSDLAHSFDRYTYKDLKNWPNDFRCELIDGVVYMMSSPSGWHQRMSMSLGRQLGNFFEGKDCQPFAAPYDVRLFPQEDEQDNVIVQPDLMVICDKSKWSDGGICNGPPDLIIEILSDSTRSFDLDTKYNQYKKAGVREYWIIGEDAVKVCQFQTNGNVVEQIYDLTGSWEVPSAIFPGLSLRFGQ